MNPLATGEAPGEPPDAADRASLIEHEECWAGAMIAGDRSAIRALMSRTLSMTTAGWLDVPVDAATWLRHVSERFVLEAGTFDEFAVRVHGDVAVVQCRSRQRGVEVGSGEAWAMVLRYSDVWLRSGSTWRIDVRHASGRRSEHGSARAPADG